VESYLSVERLVRHLELKIVLMFCWHKINILISLIYFTTAQILLELQVSCSSAHQQTCASVLYVSVYIVTEHPHMNTMSVNYVPLSLCGANTVVIVLAI